jgi:hypothetical protein
MSLNQQSHSGHSSGWDYWLEKLRQIFLSEGGDPRGSAFAVAIQDLFKDAYPLKDESTGETWYAALQALESLNESPAEVEARFILSSEKTTPKTDVFNEPVHAPVSVVRDFNEPAPQTAPRLFYFYAFTDLLPFSQNIKLFEESAIACVQNFRKRPPRSTLKEELAAQAKS